MRLTEYQRIAIREAATEAFGAGAKIWLFGSRVNDTERGGDIDLLIETDQTDVTEIARAEIAFLGKVQGKLGEQKIDLLLDYPSRRRRPLIFSIAREQGLPL
jgi:predicted nucleotidyltransferase